MEPCRVCGAKLQVWTFSAMWADPPWAAAPVAAAAPEQATCFFHAAKPAVQTCQTCGRLLCSLCAVDVGAQVVCPQCVRQRRQTKALAQLETRRVAYDHLALRLAIWPLLVTPIISLVLLAGYRRRPGSLVHGAGGLRWAAAGVIALAQLGLWALLFVYLLGRA
jgi:hypothetical protein